MSGVGGYLTLSSVTDYLGPPEKRFFSGGYRKAEHSVTGVRLTPAGAEQAGVTARVDVAYPSDWSKKKDGIDLPPHLSSIDTLVLAAQLAEAHLTHAYALNEEQRAAMRLRRVKLTAGTTPQEELTGLEARALLLETRPLEGAPGRSLSVYDCRIAKMRARCEVEHATGGRTGFSGSHDTLQDLLGPAELRYYGTGFTNYAQHIDSVSADLDELTAEAAVRLTRDEDAPATAATATAGIGGAQRPAPSMIDCFVTNLQLAQILMYELDAVRRADSNTLWMLRTVLTAQGDGPGANVPPGAAPARPLPLSTRITGKHLLPLRGGTWRNVEVAGEFAGVSLRCSLAHELPAAVAASAV